MTQETNTIQINTSIMKSIVCGMLFGLGLVGLFAIVFYVGLYFDLFVPEGYEFLIGLFFLVVLIGPFFDEIVNLVIQKRKFYIFADNAITVGSRSLLGTFQETYPITKNLTIKIRFENFACYEAIELYLFSEKVLIEKSELRNQDYEAIKSVLFMQNNSSHPTDAKIKIRDKKILLFSIILWLVVYLSFYKLYE